jgi:glycosyltransferase involved in cell wall biosynthesis
MKILHLSLAHGGGIVSAMNTYIDNSPHCEHFLMSDSSNGFSVDATKRFTQVFEVSFSIVGIFKILKLYRYLRPDYVHLHSSLSGSLGKLIFWNTKLVYTPHCYAFERQDVSKVKRFLFKLVESIATLKRCTLAACSPRELELGNSICLLKSSSENSELLINYSQPVNYVWKGYPAEQIVVMVGRLCQQKGPGFFLETCELIKLRSLQKVKFIWIGSGDDAWVEKLEGHGVEVTGWLPGDALLEKIASAAIYFHSASWEGCPMSVLEAAQIGTPIVARNIPSLESIGLDALGYSPSNCADLIINSLRDKETHKAQRDRINELCSKKNQTQALKSVYR